MILLFSGDGEEDEDSSSSSSYGDGLANSSRAARSERSHLIVWQVSGVSEWYPYNVHLESSSTLKIVALLSAAILSEYRQSQIRTLKKAIYGSQNLSEESFIPLKLSILMPASTHETVVLKKKKCMYLLKKACLS